MATRTSKKLCAILLFAVVLIGGYVAIRYGMAHYYKKAYPQKYSELVEKYADQYGVDHNLVYAVIRTESGFVHTSVSHVGASGLMQITEDTFNWAKTRMKDQRPITYTDDIFNEEINVQYGVYILSLLLDEYQSTNTALVAYHAGRGTAQKYLKDPQKTPNGIDIQNVPPGETKEYIEKVTQTQHTYECIYTKGEKQDGKQK